MSNIRRELILLLKNKYVSLGICLQFPEEISRNYLLLRNNCLPWKLLLLAGNREHALQAHAPARCNKKQTYMTTLKRRKKFSLYCAIHVKHNLLMFIKVNTKNSKINVPSQTVIGRNETYQNEITLKVQQSKLTFLSICTYNTKKEKEIFTLLGNTYETHQTIILLFIKVNTKSSKINAPSQHCHRKK